MANVLPGMTNHPQRGWSIDLGNGGWLAIEGLELNGETFDIVDFAEGKRGRSWPVRYSNIDSDFAEFVEEFEMLQALRASRKPLEPEEPLGHWVHGEDGMSEWVFFKKDDEEEEEEAQ